MDNLRSLQIVLPGLKQRCLCPPSHIADGACEWIVEPEEFDELPPCPAHLLDLLREPGQQKPGQTLSGLISLMDSANPVTTGIYFRGEQRDSASVDPAEMIAVKMLGTTKIAESASEKLGTLPPFTNHYSNYNTSGS